MKTLVIINGVTGAIGTACLARFSREPNTTIIGLSRQANQFSAFTGGGCLLDKTIVCSIGSISDRPSCKAFVQAIDLSLYKRLVYIHAVGVYPFELGSDGRIVVGNDEDGDNIDDRVIELTYKAFFAMSNALVATGLSICTLIFGGIADRHHLAVHQSWWRVMEIAKGEMKSSALKHTNIRHVLLNISSVICPNEIITRPFVFQRTDADPRFWLTPHEVADKTFSLSMDSQDKGFVEEDLFHYADYYHPDYFTETSFTERKKAELGINSS